MKKLKIGYFADGPWSHEAFNQIIKNPNISVKFITPRFDTTDKTLFSFAEEHNIPYFKLKNINSPESIEKIKNFDCDLLVSMSFNQIFKEKIINLTKFGIINCHAGKLPFYRGRNILNWALINDEKEFGITVHFVDEGIDTGDIILQRVFPITETDSYATLLEVAYVECANILSDALQKFINNEIIRIPQNIIHPVGMYCGKRGMGDEIIDWNKSSREIYNFIRAINAPGPKATTYLQGSEVKINASRYNSKAPKYIGKPGQILSKTIDGYLVKTKDSFIEILEIENQRVIKVGYVFK